MSRRVPHNSDQPAPRPASTSLAFADRYSPPGGEPTLLERLTQFAVIVVFVARCLVPTEGADTGESLWLAMFSWLPVVLWCLRNWRQRQFTVRLTWADAAWGALVLAHVFSALVILVAGGGDRRASLNLLWEWIGVGATCFIGGQVFLTAAARGAWLRVVAGLAVALACLGIYQHYIGNPSMVRDYERLIGPWDELHRKGRPDDPKKGAEWDREVQKLQLELVQQNTPLEPHRRLLYEQRLKASTEPLGLFSLTNSFAALLLVGAIFWIAMTTLEVRDGRDLAVSLTCGGVALLVVFCLLLTKSRTGYVGLAAGTLAWLAVFGWRRLWGNPLLRRLGLGAVVLAIGLPVVAALTGGLDRLVVSESMKSLRYRLEYWRGTAGVLGESRPNWLIGVGPGNFRGHYLRHKLPESSEEINDPHNLVLDAWVNGGLFALAGLCVLAAGIVPGLRALTDSRGEPQPAERPAPQFDAREFPAAASEMELPAAVWGSSGAIAAGVAVWLVTQDERAIYVAAGLAMLLYLGRSLRIPAAAQPAVMSAAAVGLVVHLLGAGGLAMPAITQLLGMLVLLNPATRDRETAGGHRLQDTLSRLLSGRWIGPTLAVLALVGMFACWRLAVFPVTQRKLLIDEGTLARLRGEARRANDLWILAAEFDPFSSEPLAALARQKLTAAEEGYKGFDKTSFAEAVKLQEMAIDLNPLDVGVHRGLREIWWTKYEWFRKDKTHPPNPSKSAQMGVGAVEAEKLDQRICAMYPNNSALRTDWAVSLQALGKTDQAAEQAKKALELDEINHRAGHTDKWLDEPVVKQLRAIQQRVFSDAPKGQL